MPKQTFRIDGLRLKQLRNSRRFSQQKLADATDLSLDTIQNIEGGRRKDGRDTLVHEQTVDRIASSLRVKPSDLLADIAPGFVESFGDEVPQGILDCVASFDTFIDERTRGFVGREFLRGVVDQFIGGGKNPSGYLFIEGVPGIGKSAFLARLIEERNYRVYHFNRAVQKINTAAQFLRNVCARIVVECGLDYDRLPDHVTVDGEFFSRVLKEASKTLKDDAYLVILIDALDEVDRSTLPPRENLLYLPETLPDRVYVIATTRPLTDLPLRVAYSPPPYRLQANSPENRHDAKIFIESQIENQGIRQWMDQQHLTREACIELFLDRSECNFMYLRHVIPAIDKGWLQSLDARNLPPGLDAYYREHWRHMRSLHPEFDRGNPSVS